MAQDVFVGESLGCACEPRVNNQFAQLVERDQVKADENRRVPVEVRGREVDLGVVGEQRVLGAEMLYPRTEDRAGGCAVAEGAKVCGAQRTFPQVPAGFVPLRCPGPALA